MYEVATIVNVIYLMRRGEGGHRMAKEEGGAGDTFFVIGQGTFLLFVGVGFWRMLN